jgi:dephospho-CoA kinase
VTAAMLRLGLTGGIASGKSVVAGILREFGFSVLDADSLAHALIEPGQPAYYEVAREFGAEILAPNGQINRAKLGSIVFADRDKLERLNAIIHPRVEATALRQLDQWALDGIRQAAFIEAALLVEAGYHKILDGLVIAWCRPEQQVERLLARGFTEDEARQRIAAQLPLEEKLRYATEAVDCSRTLEETRRQVETLAAKLRSQTGGTE